MTFLRTQFGPARHLLAGVVLRRAVDCCLWLSLPLSIWLISGWIGLVLHWQAELSAASLLERITVKPPRFRQVI
jgi:hypothetical protein